LARYHRIVAATSATRKTGAAVRSFGFELSSIDVLTFKKFSTFL
jgi:hypothetical protein